MWPLLGPTHDTQTQPQVSGKAFLGLISHLKSAHGPELLAGMLEEGESEMRAVFERRIAINSWHPYVAYVELLRQIERRLGSGNGDTCRELGAVAGRRDLGTVFRLYRVLASPQRLIRGCSQVWRSYYRNAGRMEAISWAPENTTLRIYDFLTMHPLHCRLMEGWMVSSMEAIGCRVDSDFRESACTSRGDPHHEFRCSWRAAR